MMTFRHVTEGLVAIVGVLLIMAIVIGSIIGVYNVIEELSYRG